MAPQARFCTSADRTSIAYGTIGEGPPLVHLGPWATNMELDWERPDGRTYMEGLAEGRMLVWPMRRGVGTSQRDVEDMSLEAQLADLTAVIDAMRLESFDLCGVEDGGALCIAYAAEHPAQVGRLVLWGPIVHGTDVVGADAGRSLVDLVRTNWPLARRTIADLYLPNGPAELRRWASSYLREAMSNEVAAKHLEFVFSLDVRAFASRVQAPTLVLHRRLQHNIPIAAGRAAAALIPDARFVALEGDVGVIHFQPEQALKPIREFLDAGREVPVTAAADASLDRGPVAIAASAGGIDVHTILFTDMESSTSIRQQLGDEKAQAIVHVHDSIVRDALKAHGGSEIKHMGDGIMASFTSASQALQSAVTIQRAVAAYREGEPNAPLSVYIGLNAGEPIAEEGDLFGTSVDLAKRICDQCRPGEILASNVVRELAAGRQFLFSDRGDTALRGFEDPVRLYEVRWREET